MKKIMWFFGAVSDFIEGIIVKIVEAIMSKWIFGIVYLFFLAGPSLFIYISLSDPQKDTTFLTNIAFAILAGISSVTFSWARAVEDTDAESNKRIIKAGELCLQATIFFLLASAFKYTFINFPVKQPEALPLHIIRKCIHYLSIILFSLAILNFMTSTLRICLILRDRIKKS